MNKDEQSCKKAKTRWWTWSVLGFVVAAMCVGFVFRYELFGSASVRAVRKIGWKNETGELKSLRKVQDEMLAEIILAGFEAIESMKYSEGMEHFNKAQQLTSDTSIRRVLFHLFQECETESSLDKEIKVI